MISTLIFCKNNTKKTTMSNKRPQGSKGKKTPENNSGVGEFEKILNINLNDLSPEQMRLIWLVFVKGLDGKKVFFIKKEIGSDETYTVTGKEAIKIMKENPSLIMDKEGSVKKFLASYEQYLIVNNKI